MIALAIAGTIAGIAAIGFTLGVIALLGRALADATGERD